MRCSRALCLFVSMLCAACSGARNESIQSGIRTAGPDADIVEEQPAQPDAPSEPEIDREMMPDTAMDATLGEDVVTTPVMDAAPAPEIPADASQALLETGADAQPVAPDDGSTLLRFAEFDAGVDCVGPIGSPLRADEVGLPDAGLVLWLRGDVGIYKTDAGAVCAWTDATGKGTTLTAVSTRPSWSETAVAGQPGIRFLAAQPLGIDNVLGIPAQSARTFVAIQTLNTLRERFQAVHQGETGSNSAHISIDTNTWQTRGQREGVYASNSSFDSTLSTSSATRLHVFMVGPMVIGTQVANALRYRINATELTLAPTVSNTFQSFAGANFTRVGDGLVGINAFVSEALIYDHVLSDTEIAALESTLMARYGLQ